MHQHKLTWRGREIGWSRYGFGPPVVFSHGTPWSSRLWEPIAAAISADFTVYLWDMLGYGTSSMIEGDDVSLATQSTLFADLLERWSLTEPHVIAHDFGGAVSLRTHLLHGSVYRSLALVDAVALAPWGSEFFRLVADHAAVFTQLPAPMHQALTKAYIRGAAHRRLRDTDLDMLTEPWTTASGQVAFYRQIAQADQRYTDEVEPLYPTIEMPVLIAWGAEDTWIPVDRAHRLHELIADSQLHLVEGAGHLIQLDAPERLTAILQRWLLTQSST